MANQTDKNHALAMLGKYLPDAAPTMHVVVVGATDGTNNRIFKRVFTAIDGPRIVNLNLYIANLLGLRRDQWGNTCSNMTPQEIASAISDKLGRTVTVYGI